MFECPCCNKPIVLVQNRLCDACEDEMCANYVGEEESMIESMKEEGRLRFQHENEVETMDAWDSRYADEDITTDCDNPDEWMKQTMTNEYIESCIARAIKSYHLTQEDVKKIRQEQSKGTSNDSLYDLLVDLEEKNEGKQLAISRENEKQNQERNEHWDYLKRNVL